MPKLSLDKPRFADPKSGRDWFPRAPGSPGSAKGKYRYQAVFSPLAFEPFDHLIREWFEEARKDSNQPLAQPNGSTFFGRSWQCTYFRDRNVAPAKHDGLTALNLFQIAGQMGLGLVDVEPYHDSILNYILN